VTISQANPDPKVCESCTASMIESFEKKPANGGKPAFASAPISTVR